MTGLSAGKKNGDFAQAKIRVSPKKSHIIYK